MGILAAALTNLLPQKYRSGGVGGKTTAQDAREYETQVIAAISQLELLARGSRLFAAELYGATPAPADAQIDDVYLDTAVGTVWVYVDGEWVSRGNLKPADGSKILGGTDAPVAVTGKVGDWYFQYNIAAHEKTVNGWVSRFPLGGAAVLPDQANQAGKFLCTSGGGAFWATVPADYSDAQAKTVAAALLTNMVSTNLLATYNAGTGLLTANVKPASLKVTDFAATDIVAAQFPASEQTKITTAANWTNGVYTGVGTQALTGVEEGMFHTSGGYAIRATAANAAVCWKLTSFGS